MTPQEAIKQLEYDRGMCLFNPSTGEEEPMNEDCRKSAEALGLAIEALEQQDKSRWIPCSEKLPEYGAEVLTINTDGDYEINHIIDEEDAEWFYNGAIAWTPLPEPYKEDNNDTTGSNRQGL